LIEKREPRDRRTGVGAGDLEFFQRLVLCASRPQDSARSVASNSNR
jgi:hypothetical protein